MSVERAQIRLNDIRLYAYHGVTPQEREVGGWYRVSLAMDYPFAEALYSDDLADTADYSEALAVVRREMSVPAKLLERVAGRIAEAIFGTFPKTERVEVELTKENPPMGSDTAGASVRIIVKNDKIGL